MLLAPAPYQPTARPNGRSSRDTCEELRYLATTDTRTGASTITRANDNAHTSTNNTTNTTAGTDANNKTTADDGAGANTNT